MHEIVTHRRLYVENEPESMDCFIDHCENAERGQVLKTLAALTERNGFDSALTTVDEAIRLQARDAEK